MRWIDKPRKKTRRDVVLEYIKFLKIMGLYSNAVAYMYRESESLSGRVVPLYNSKKLVSYSNCNVLCCNKHMIQYLEGRLIYTSKLSKEAIGFLLVMVSLNARPTTVGDIVNLLWSYFQEKHIANCILVD